MGVKKRYFHNQKTDALIMSAYSDPEYGTKRGRPILALSARLGWPKEIIRRRALQIGAYAPKKKEPQWSEQEMEILDKHAHKSTGVIRRNLKKAGFDRSEAAISIRRARFLEGITQARMDAGLYSAKQVANLLCVDNKTVSRWASSGLLKAKRRGTLRIDIQHGDEWEISESAIREFVINYTAHIRLDRLEKNKYWFIDLLTGTSRAKGKACDEAA